MKTEPCKIAKNGVFALNTVFNSYRLEVRHGVVIDTPPVLKEFVKKKIGILLGAVHQHEGQYELLKILPE